MSTNLVLFLDIAENRFEGNEGLSRGITLKGAIAHHRLKLPTTLHGNQQRIQRGRFKLALRKPSLWRCAIARLFA